MTFKSPTRPLCRACGKPIAKATDTIWFGSQKDTTSGSWRYRIEKPTTKAEAQRLVNQQIVSVRLSGLGYLSRVSVWDGESWQDEFFCNSICTNSFARMAARSYPPIYSQSYVNAIKANQLSTTRRDC